MAQMQNIIDFPPAPKLDPFGPARPGARRREQELAGEKVFLGKGRCAECHVPQHVVHGPTDARPEARALLPRRARRSTTSSRMPDGPIKTFTLRGIKDSPPYLHDGRLLTLADTVEFFNLVLGLKLDAGRRRMRSSPTCSRCEPRASPCVPLARLGPRGPAGDASAQIGNPGSWPPTPGPTITRHARRRPDTTPPTCFSSSSLGEGGLAEVASRRARRRRRRRPPAVKDFAEQDGRGPHRRQ